MVLGALSALGTAVFWGLMGYGIFKAAGAASRQLEAQLRDAERLGRSLSGPGGAAGAKQAEFLRMLSNLDGQMRHLDSLRRQQYDLRVSELQGMAAQAGISWTPPS